MAAPESKKLADKIAKILESETQGTDLPALFASIEKINHRLDKLEAGVAVPASEISKLRSEISDLKPAHSSLDKFNVAEAITDSIFSRYKKEKACQFEPDKPCDHCSMCNSRGF
jgi:predicted  nucleic acid-binding Zn-ribbon protein